MTTKQGRPRRFDFGADGLGGPELSSLLGFLDELAVRTEDQVSHLPPEALNFLGPNSTLSVGRLVLHLIGSELTMLGKVVPGAPVPPYQARLDKGLLTDFASPPGDLSYAPQLLREHLAFRRTHLLEPCRVPGTLERPVDPVSQPLTSPGTRSTGFTKQCNSQTTAATSSMSS